MLSEGGGRFRGLLFHTNIQQNHNCMYTDTFDLCLPGTRLHRIKLEKCWGVDEWLDCLRRGFTYFSKLNIILQILATNGCFIMEP